MGLNAMAVIKLPYVVSDVDRHGNVRYYFRRRPEPKVRLPAKPGTLEFREAYEAAQARKPVARPTKKPHETKGTFAYACHHYFNDKATFKRLDKSTQGWQRRALDEIAAAYGDRILTELAPRNVRKFRDEKADTPAAANNMLKALRALFEFAKENDLADTDPTREVKRIKYVAKGHHSWSLNEVADFEERWPIGTKQRLALALLLYTACRREDVVRLGPSHFRGERIVYTQAKNEHRNPVHMDIPVHPDLADVIAATTVKGDTYLTTEYGKPFSVAGFGNRFRDWCDQAGLSHCSAHGLRKATAARLAERGATPHEIMAITGHQTLGEVQRYTKAAQMRGLADAGMALLPNRKKAEENGGTSAPKSVESDRSKTRSHNDSSR